MKRALLVLPLLTGACLTPTPVGDETLVGSEAQGQLIEGQFHLTWQWRDPWESGTCVDCVLQNMGPTVPGFELTVGLDQNIDEIVYSRGANIVSAGNRLTVTNFWGTDLNQGEALSFEMCAEPRIMLDDIVDVTIVDEEEEAVDPQLYGTLLDQDGILGMQFFQEGSANGGDCLTLIIKNLSDERLESWYIEMEMSDQFVMTYSDVLWPYQFTDRRLYVYPDPGHIWLGPYYEASGAICVSPIVVPTEIWSTLQYAEY